MFILLSVPNYAIALGQVLNICGLYSSECHLVVTLLLYVDYVNYFECLLSIR